MVLIAGRPCVSFPAISLAKIEIIKKIIEPGDMLPLCMKDLIDTSLRQFGIGRFHIASDAARLEVLMYLQELEEKEYHERKEARLRPRFPLQLIWRVRYRAYEDVYRSVLLRLRTRMLEERHKRHSLSRNLDHNELHLPSAHCMKSIPGSSSAWNYVWIVLCCLMPVLLSLTIAYIIVASNGQPAESSRVSTTRLIVIIVLVSSP